MFYKKVYNYRHADVQLISDRLSTTRSAQHDELEPNLKKILHRNGIWGLEAVVM